MNLFRIAVARPIATSMVFIAIIVFGVFSYIRLPLDLFPEVENPVITVITTYQGSGALEIEKNVTDHLEASLSTVPNLKEMTSNSVDNVSTIMLEFEYGINLDEAANDIRDVLGRTTRLLPDDVDEPFLFKFSSSAIPVIVFSATADQSYADLENILDDRLVGPLNRIPGVGAVNIYGAPIRQVEVVVDPQRFEAYGLDIQQVAQVLAAENLIYPAGQIDMGPNSLNLRVNGEFVTTEEIGDVVLANREGRIVYLHEVATVRDGFADETAISRVNGRQGVTLTVQKQTDANTVQVAQEVMNRLPSLMEALPPDVELNLIFDTSEFITDSINNLAGVIFYAILFVVLVVLVFLRQWRATVIIASTIPISLVVAFIYLALTGSTLNIISLSSLSIALGMVVDDAIVVLENIAKHVERGTRPVQAAIYGTSEVAVAVVATTLTVVAVFLPLTFITGMTGIWFRELGFIVTVTIITSTVAALSLTPMMSALLLRRADEGKPMPKWLNGISVGIENNLSRLDSFYGKSLSMALRKRGLVVAGAGGVFVLSLALTPLVGTEFMPQSDSGWVNVTAEVQPGRSLQFTADVANRIEDRVREEIPEVELLNSTAGSSGMGFGGGSTQNSLQLRIGLVDLSERRRSSFEIADQVRGILDDEPELVTYNVDAGQAAGGAASPVEIHVLGNDIDLTTEIAEDLADFVRTVEGTRDVETSRGEVRPELEFVFDRERLSAFGLSSAGVASTIRGNIAGLTATQYRHDGDEYDIVLRYDESLRNSLTEVENISIPTPTGQRVRVVDLGQIREYMAPPNIEHIDRERSISVTAGLMQRPLSDVMADIRGYVDQMQIPPQIEVVYGGDFESQQESFRDLFLVLLLSIILVYLVMAAQFESLREPFIIMFSVPFAFSGVIFAMLLTNTKVGVIGLLGAIILVGIVVKNAIVLIDYIKLLRGRGLSVVDAIVQGGISRLRPVLMTTLTTILAMLPMALSTGSGAETWRPMAISVIGGLTFSTVVTLIIVPVVYAMFDRKRVREHYETSGDGIATDEVAIPQVVPSK